MVPIAGARSFRQSCSVCTLLYSFVWSRGSGVVSSSSMPVLGGFTNNKCGKMEEASFGQFRDLKRTEAEGTSSLASDSLRIRGVEDEAGDVGAGVWVWA
mmetsp:Transcript_5753/g.10444  ORF Transcript_5753/g.10444 Transcript_5753/m.10444 type:complete len:99 (+) Transcript_5753:426-722(+)